MAVFFILRLLALGYDLAFLDLEFVIIELGVLDTFSSTILVESFLPVVTIDVAVLAHSCSIQLLVRTVPRFFRPPVLVIAVVAESLCIMLFVLMPTFINLFARINLWLLLFAKSFGLFTWFLLLKAGPFVLLWHFLQVLQLLIQ